MKINSNGFLFHAAQALVALITTIVAIGLLLTWFDTVMVGGYLYHAGFIQAALVGILPPVIIVCAWVLMLVAIYKKRY